MQSDIIVSKDLPDYSKGRMNGVMNISAYSGSGAPGCREQTNEGSTSAIYEEGKALNYDRASSATFKDDLESSSDWNSSPAELSTSAVAAAGAAAATPPSDERKVSNSIDTAHVATISAANKNYDHVQNSNRANGNCEMKDSNDVRASDETITHSVDDVGSLKKTSTLPSLEAIAASEMVPAAVEKNRASCTDIGAISPSDAKERGLAKEEFGGEEAANPGANCPAVNISSVKFPSVNCPTVNINCPSANASADAASDSKSSDAPVRYSESGAGDRKDFSGGYASLRVGSVKGTDDACADVPKLNATIESDIKMSNASVCANLVGGGEGHLSEAAHCKEGTPKDAGLNNCSDKAAGCQGAARKEGGQFESGLAQEGSIGHSGGGHSASAGGSGNASGGGGNSGGSNTGGSSNNGGNNNGGSNIGGGSNTGGSNSGEDGEKNDGDKHRKNGHQDAGSGEGSGSLENPNEGKGGEDSRKNGNGGDRGDDRSDDRSHGQKKDEHSGKAADGANRSSNPSESGKKNKSSNSVEGKSGSGKGHSMSSSKPSSNSVSTPVSSLNADAPEFVPSTKGMPGNLSFNNLMWNHYYQDMSNGAFGGVAANGMINNLAAQGSNSMMSPPNPLLSPLGGMGHGPGDLLNLANSSHMSASNGGISLSIPNNAGVMLPQVSNLSNIDARNNEKGNNLPSGGGGVPASTGGSVNNHAGNKSVSSSKLGSSSNNNANSTGHDNNVATASSNMMHGSGAAAVVGKGGANSSGTDSTFLNQSGMLPGMKNMRANNFMNGSESSGPPPFHTIDPHNAGHHQAFQPNGSMMHPHNFYVNHPYLMNNHPHAHPHHPHHPHPNALPGPPQSLFTPMSYANSLGTANVHHEFPFPQPPPSVYGSFGNSTNLIGSNTTTALSSSKNGTMGMNPYSFMSCGLPAHPPPPQLQHNAPLNLSAPLEAHFISGSTGNAAPPMKIPYNHVAQPNRRNMFNHFNMANMHAGGTTLTDGTFEHGVSSNNSNMSNVIGAAAAAAAGITYGYGNFGATHNVSGSSSDNLLPTGDNAGSNNSGSAGAANAGANSSANNGANNNSGSSSAGGMHLTPALGSNMGMSANGSVMCINGPLHMTNVSATNVTPLSHHHMNQMNNVMAAGAAAGGAAMGTMTAGGMHMGTMQMNHNMMVNTMEGVGAPIGAAAVTKQQKRSSTYGERNANGGGGGGSNNNSSGKAAGSHREGKGGVKGSNSNSNSVMASSAAAGAAAGGGSGGGATGLTSYGKQDSKKGSKYGGSGVGSGAGGNNMNVNFNAHSGNNAGHAMGSGSKNMYASGKGAKQEALYGRDENGNATTTTPGATASPASNGYFGKGSTGNNNNSNALLSTGPGSNNMSGAVHQKESDLSGGLNESLDDISANKHMQYDGSTNEGGKGSFKGKAGAYSSLGNSGNARSKGNNSSSSNNMASAHAAVTGSNNEAIAAGEKRFFNKHEKGKDDYKGGKSYGSNKMGEEKGSYNHIGGGASAGAAASSKKDASKDNIKGGTKNGEVHVKKQYNNDLLGHSNSGNMANQQQPLGSSNKQQGSYTSGGKYQSSAEKRVGHMRNAEGGKGGSEKKLKNEDDKKFKEKDGNMLAGPGGAAKGASAKAGSTPMGGSGSNFAVSNMNDQGLLPNSDSMNGKNLPGVGTPDGVNGPYPNSNYNGSAVSNSKSANYGNAKNAKSYDKKNTEFSSWVKIAKMNPNKKKGDKGSLNGQQEGGSNHAPVGGGVAGSSSITNATLKHHDGGSAEKGSSGHHGMGGAAGVGDPSNNSFNSAKGRGHNNEGAAGYSKGGSSTINGALHMGHENGPPSNAQSSRDGKKRKDEEEQRAERHKGMINKDMTGMNNNSSVVHYGKSSKKGSEDKSDNMMSSNAKNKKLTSYGSGKNSSYHEKESVKERGGKMKYDNGGSAGVKKMEMVNERKGGAVGSGGAGGSAVGGSGGGASGGGNVTNTSGSIYSSHRQREKMKIQNVEIKQINEKVMKRRSEDRKEATEKKGAGAQEHVKRVGGTGSSSKHTEREDQSDAVKKQGRDHPYEGRSKAHCNGDVKNAEYEQELDDHEGAVAAGGARDDGVKKSHLASTWTSGVRGESGRNKDEAYQNDSQNENNAHAGGSSSIHDNNPQVRKGENAHMNKEGSYKYGAGPSEYHGHAPNQSVSGSVNANVSVNAAANAHDNRSVSTYSNSKNSVWDGKISFAEMAKRKPKKETKEPRGGDSKNGKSESSHNDRKNAHHGSNHKGDKPSKRRDQRGKRYGSNSTIRDKPSGTTVHSRGGESNDKKNHISGNNNHGSNSTSRDSARGGASEMRKRNDLKEHAKKGYDGGSAAPNMRDSRRRGGVAADAPLKGYHNRREEKDMMDHVMADQNGTLSEAEGSDDAYHKRRGGEVKSGLRDGLMEEEKGEVDEVSRENATVEEEEAVEVLEAVEVVEADEAVEAIEGDGHVEARPGAAPKPDSLQMEREGPKKMYHGGAERMPNPVAHEDTEDAEIVEGNKIVGSNNNVTDDSGSSSIAKFSPPTDADVSTHRTDEWSEKGAKRHGMKEGSAKLFPDGLSKYEKMKLEDAESDLQAVACEAERHGIPIGGAKKAHVVSSAADHFAEMNAQGGQSNRLSALMNGKVSEPSGDAKYVRGGSSSRAVKKKGGLKGASGVSGERGVEGRADGRADGAGTGKGLLEEETKTAITIDTEESVKVAKLSNEDLAAAKSEKSKAGGKKKYGLFSDIKKWAKGKLADGAGAADGAPQEEKKAMGGGSKDNQNDAGVGSAGDMGDVVKKADDVVRKADDVVRKADDVLPTVDVKMGGMSNADAVPASLNDEKETPAGGEKEEISGSNVAPAKVETKSKADGLLDSLEKKADELEVEKANEKAAVQNEKDHEEAEREKERQRMKQMKLERMGKSKIYSKIDLLEIFVGNKWNTGEERFNFMLSYNPDVDCHKMGSAMMGSCNINHMDMNGMHANNHMGGGHAHEGKNSMYSKRYMNAGGSGGGHGSGGSGGMNNNYMGGNNNHGNNSGKQFGMNSGGGGKNNDDVWRYAQGGKSGMNNNGHFANGGANMNFGDMNHSNSGNIAGSGGKGGMGSGGGSMDAHNAGSGGLGKMGQANLEWRKNDGDKLKGFFDSTRAVESPDAWRHNNNHSGGGSSGGGGKTVAENSWLLKQNQLKADKYTCMMRKLRGILNKLTFEKFDLLYEQIILVGITKLEEIIGLMKLVFEKAVTQHHFVQMYVQLCKKLNVHFQNMKLEDDTTVQFKKILINQCQDSFENNLKPIEYPSNLTNEEERFEFEQMHKNKVRGNMLFVGELVKSGIISIPIVFVCIKQLLEKRESYISAKNDTNEGNLHLEALCMFLNTVGEILDTHEKANQEKVKELYNTLHALINDESITFRVRCLIKDVIDNRNEKWNKKFAHKLEGPTTLSVLHDKILKESIDQSSRSFNSSSNNMGNYHDSKMNSSLSNMRNNLLRNVNFNMNSGNSGGGANVGGGLGGSSNNSGNSNAGFGMMNMRNLGGGMKNMDPNKNMKKLSLNLMKAKNASASKMMGDDMMKGAGGVSAVSGVSGACQDGANAGGSFFDMMSKNHLAFKNSHQAFMNNEGSSGGNTAGGAFFSSLNSRFPAKEKSGSSGSPSEGKFFMRNFNLKKSPVGSGAVGSGPTGGGAIGSAANSAANDAAGKTEEQPNDAPMTATASPSTESVSGSGSPNDGAEKGAPTAGSPSAGANGASDDYAFTEEYLPKVNEILELSTITGSDEWETLTKKIENLNVPPKFNEKLQKHILKLTLKKYACNKNVEKSAEYFDWLISIVLLNKIDLESFKPCWKAFMLQDDENGYECTKEDYPLLPFLAKNFIKAIELHDTNHLLYDAATVDEMKSVI
ncbi:polyadenylate-binding protein-interacting protein 1, putative [Plasmodium vivax]|uniref:Polyadenylate-binding protein-interacting protein 1, putative n=1 Tax=Plasmodium vivax TaxID=5855 RepID=A0A1G4HCA9_PLAVI|nr:polyadenylate-binding protein-interacting protein 1, putative [Plasmodium vivax]